MWGQLLFFFFVLLCLLIVLSWFVVACDGTFDNTCDKILPGQTYQANGRTYQVPNLPHKMLGTEQKATLDRPIPKLPDEYLARLRTLGSTAFQLLRQAQVPFWVTGGTLFSAHVWHHFMPFDDDIDLSVLWEDRPYIWSPEFAKLASLSGLEVVTLRGSSLSLATREGGGVRLRLKGHYTPMLDIFFTQKIDETHYAKIDSWTGNTAHPNSKEIWNDDWLFPLRDVDVDGILWSVPHQPEFMLKKQYGPHCMESIQSPDPLVKTHVWVTYFTNYVGAWRIQPLSTKTHIDQLINPRGYVVPPTPTPSVTT